MSITIFLADDHAVVRDGLRLLLETQPDMRVIGEAANGRDAVLRVVELKPDVVIMDIGMPELNGIEATRQILEQCPATQVVILSMHSTDEHVFGALQAGVRGYVLKESAGVEVIEATRVVMNGRLYLSPPISLNILDDYASRGANSSAKSPLSRLSPREREVMQLVVEGRSSAEIGELLALSPKTVETYRSRIMHKLGIKDIPTLVKFAIQHGLTSLE